MSASQYDRAEGVKVAANIENNAREKERTWTRYGDGQAEHPGEQFLMSGVPTRQDCSSPDGSRAL